MYKVLGIEKVDYVSKRTGNSVRGVKLHLLSDTVKSGLDGNEVETVFVSSTILCPDIFVGCDLDVFYNRFGSVSQIEVL